MGNLAGLPAHLAQLAVGQGAGQHTPQGDEAGQQLQDKGTTPARYRQRTGTDRGSEQDPRRIIPPRKDRALARAQGGTASAT